MVNPIGLDVLLIKLAKWAKEKLTSIVNLNLNKSLVTMEDVLREILVNPSTGRFYSSAWTLSITPNDLPLRDLVSLVPGDKDEALIARCIHRHFKGILNVFIFFDLLQSA